MNELRITEYRGQRVLTTQQIAESYGTTEKVISNNFNNNKSRYQERKHYLLLQGEELKQFKGESLNLGIAQNVNKFYLWTEKGAFLHAKSLNTDTAWEVYDRLVDSYFKKKEDLLEGLSPELRAVIVVDKRVTMVEQKIGHLENTMTIDYAQQKELRNLSKSVVISLVGGKKSLAYTYQYPKQSENDKPPKLYGTVVSRIWHDFQDYFGVNSYNNTPVARFDEAKLYLNNWNPPINMQLEIGKINRGEM